MAPHRTVPHKMNDIISNIKCVREGRSFAAGVTFCLYFIKSRDAVAVSKTWAILTDDW